MFSLYYPSGIKYGSNNLQIWSSLSKILGILLSAAVAAADECGASSSHPNPDVTGCFYNIFNAVMTDTAYTAPLACLENVPGTVQSFCLTQNPPQK